MAQNPIAASLEILAVPVSGIRSSGGLEAARNPTLWHRLVEVIRGSIRTGRTSKPVADLSYPLSSPQECADAHLEEIEEAFGKSSRGSNQAALLKKLAGWWMTSFGNELDAEWDGSTDRWRESLRSIRGVNHETADRLLLLVAEKPAWPVSRASIRIACRHGWIEPTAEYDEWQSLFVRGCDSNVDALRALSSRFDEIGRTHCGPKPKCEGCPLAPLLPSGGPREMFD